MDFSNLMDLASNNQQKAVNKGKGKMAKEGGSGQVSSAAVKAFLARQNAEKAKQKEQDEAARRARIQARLQGKQLEKSKKKKATEDVSVNQCPQNSLGYKNPPRSEDSPSRSKVKHSVIEKTRADEGRRIAKSLEKEKLKARADERTSYVDEKKSMAKVKKCAPPAMSFQELMNIAKKQADNPDAVRSATVVNEPKEESNKTVRRKSPPKDHLMKDERKKEIRITEKSNAVSGKCNGEKKRSLQKQRVQTVQSRDRIQPESHERKRPENRGGKHTESCNRKQLEIRDRMSNGKFQGKPESNVKRKLSEKPRTMTIERETISQRDYGLPRDHGGARLRAHFPPKRRHNPYDDDEYDEDMDSFIDDSEEATETVSSYIKDIFGYDRNKFHDREEDVRNMESSFADIQKEEAKSLRIAKLEDEVERLKESYELQQQQRKKLKH